VGNGGQIRSWNDKGLPKNTPPQCITLRGGLSEEANVTKLTDWETKRWKLSLVREMFGEAIVTHICQIPIGSIHNSDR
jgi:hypothetical protein